MKLPMENKLGKYITSILTTSNPLVVTPRMIRTELESKLGLCEGGLEERKETIKELTLIMYGAWMDDWDKRRELNTSVAKTCLSKGLYAISSEEACLV